MWEQAGAKEVCATVLGAHSTEINISATLDTIPGMFACII